MKAAPSASPLPPIAVTLYLIRHGESRHNSGGNSPSQLHILETFHVIRQRSLLRILHISTFLAASRNLDFGELLLQQDHGLSVRGAAQCNNIDYEKKIKRNVQNIV